MIIAVGIGELQERGLCRRILLLEERIHDVLGQQIGLLLIHGPELRVDVELGDIHAQHALAEGIDGRDGRSREQDQLPLHMVPFPL